MTKVPITIILVIIMTFSSLLIAKTFQGSRCEIRIDDICYQLNISEVNISKLKDTVFGRKKCLITDCPLTLNNNTNDTLRYAGMQTSWWDIYAIDNKDFFLAADYWNVFKNGSIVYVLPPHQFITTKIKIITYKDYCRGEKLKIAMHLQKVIHVPKVGDIKLIRSDSNYVIWSNEVTIN